MDNQFRELNPVLRDFRHAPSATAVLKTEDVWSAVPSTFKIRSPTGPGNIDVPETVVCEKLAQEVVPQIFTPSSMNVYREQEMAWMSDDIDEGGEDWIVRKENRSDNNTDLTIGIGHNNLNRLLLHHAYMGFTFESAPQCIHVMLQTSKSVEEDEEDDVLAVGRQYPMDEDQASSAIRNAVQRFKHHMLVFNMHMLSALLFLRSGWAFAIALESSPHFGLHGIEARLCVYGPRASQLSFHLIGIQDSQKDVERLHKLLSTLSPIFPLKLLGIVTNLDGKEQVQEIEEIVSVMTAHFARLVPASRPFYSRGSTDYLKQIPILPQQLWSTTSKEFEKLVDQYRSMLEISWNPTEIAKIQEQHEMLKKESKSSLEAGLSLEPSVEADMDRDKNHVQGRFDEEWKFLGTRFPHLRNFVGGLSTAFNYVPKSRNHIVINKIQPTPRYFDRKEPPFLNPNAEDANVVLQACQFEELRSYLER